MTEFLALAMFGTLVATLLLGFPVAFTLGAIAIFFGIPTLGLDIFSLLPMRIYGIMTNFTLLAVPLFIFMGVILERSGLAERLLRDLSDLFGSLRGGLTVSAVLVGAILGATTGVVGATVVTLGVIALPAMIRQKYPTGIAAGTIATAGTLGQIIPPSIVLILLADIMGVAVGKLFVGAIIPSAILIILYIGYLVFHGLKNPDSFPKPKTISSVDWKSVLISISPPLLLIIIVLGSIILGIASPTESAALGCVGALLLSLASGEFSFNSLKESAAYTVKLTSMVFIILVGATAFSLVFKGLGGDLIIRDSLLSLESGQLVFIVMSMLLIFLMGFFLDFIEISFIVIPILVPICHLLNIDPLWFGLMVAINLQTSFLTPPFGFSIFYLKAVSPKEIETTEIYKGVLPFIGIQLVVLLLLALFPQLVTWLPKQAF